MIETAAAPSRPKESTAVQPIPKPQVLDPDRPLRTAAPRSPKTTARAPNCSTSPYTKAAPTPSSSGTTSTPPASTCSTACRPIRVRPDRTPPRPHPRPAPTTMRGGTTGSAPTPPSHQRCAARTATPDSASPALARKRRRGAPPLYSGSTPGTRTTPPPPVARPNMAKRHGGRAANQGTHPDDRRSRRPRRDPRTANMPPTPGWSTATHPHLLSPSIMTSEPGCWPSRSGHPRRTGGSRR